MTDTQTGLENSKLAEIAKYIDPQNEDALNNAVMEAMSTINSLLTGHRVKGIHIDLAPANTPLINQPDNMRDITPLGLTWCWWRGLSFCTDPNEC